MLCKQPGVNFPGHGHNSYRENTTGWRVCDASFVAEAEDLLQRWDNRTSSFQEGSSACRTILDVRGKYDQ